MAKKILIVDDEPDVLQVLSMRLKANGYEVIEAMDGLEALKIARSDKPDLIVLDLMLPKQSGYNVCRMLKFDKNFKDIPIVMFTARVGESDQKMGQEVGADAYLTKTEEASVVLSTIKNLLERKNLS